MAQIKLTKSAIDAAQSQAQPVELREQLGWANFHQKNLFQQTLKAAVLVKGS